MHTIYWKWAQKDNFIEKWQEKRSKKEQCGFEEFGGILLEELMKRNSHLNSNMVLANS